MKRILILLFLVVTSTSFAQIKMQGVVKDSIGSPLELANVIAINQETSALESYAITNDKGKYVLSLGKNGKYKVQVSYIGLKSFEQIITTKEEDINRDFTLMPDNSLDAVELTYEMPVTIKGDTLIYNADSFKNGSERKLEDVLEKLPGVEINEDGQVEVEGKVVNKLMVNGKDFFDGDTKLATKNIPSNAVDKVEVLRNYSEVGQLRSVTNNQDNVALNIKLKEGKENFWFGDITAGGGTAPSPNDELYLVQPKLFYYSPKYSVNIIGDMNNIGEVALTNRDLRNFGGGFGFRLPSRTSGTNINLGDNGLGGLTNIANAQEVITKLATANFSYSPSKSLDLSGFVIYNSSRLRTREESFFDYIEVEDDPSTPIDESSNIPPDEATVSRGREASNQAIAKLSASYKPNVNNQLDYDLLGRISDDEERQNLFSSVVGVTDQVDRVKPFSINQTLNYYYTLDENNIFAFEAQHLIKDEDPFYNALLVNDPTPPNTQDAFDATAFGLGLNQDQFSYDINQERRVKSNQLDAKLDYYNILNAKSNINLTLGTILSNQKFNSNIFQFLDNGAQFNPTPTITDEDGNPLSAENDNVDYSFRDIYLGVHYRFKTGKFTFTPGLSFHAYGNKNTQGGDTFEDNFFNVLPDFEARIQFKKSESLQFNYNMTNTFTDVTNIAEGLVLNNFNSIQFGNPELQNALSHNIRLFYSSFNLFNYTNVFAGLNYSKNEDQIRSLTNFQSVIRTNSFFNSQFADETASLFGRVQRTFGKIRASLRANFSYSKFNQFIQSSTSPSINESFTQNYTPEIRTNFREAPNVRLRYGYTIRNNDQGANSNKFITRAPSIEFDAYIWDAVTFVTDFTYTEQENNGQVEDFKTWNASLRYRKGRDAKWEYSLRASNILDIDSNISNGAGNISVFSSETFIQPRFLTFRLTYTL
ncbi:TonB-dependent receptor [Winogradskyella flava]|uniref:TonB-dependent receptor n=1 Tax=Winogradskyella flava TaxID=1884876 RepID=UPI0024903F46|nr:TonB-dependent receptor [Winogradskyella flava]